jgi:hypothetical protein
MADDFRWRPTELQRRRKKGTDPVGLALLLGCVLAIVGLIVLANV